MLKPDKIGAVIVSIIVVGGFVSVLLMMIVKPMALDNNLTTLLQIMLGVFAAQFAAVVQFWIGSSAGSKSKDAIIGNIAGGANPPAPQP